MGAEREVPALNPNHFQVLGKMIEGSHDNDDDDYDDDDHNNDGDDDDDD